MAHIVKARIKDTTTSVGAGPYALGGATVANYQNLAVGMVNGDTIDLMIVNRSATEWDGSRYTMTAGALVRTRFWESSTGSPITFTAGIKDIFCYRPAADLPGSVLVGKLIGANFNSTADQAVPIYCPVPYMLHTVQAINPSVDLSAAVQPVGGIYTAVAKGGAAVVPAASNWGGLTTATKNIVGSLVVFSPLQTVLLDKATLYFALTTAHGVAATADIYIYARPVV